MLTIYAMHIPRPLIERELGTYTVRYVFVKLDGKHIEFRDLPATEAQRVTDVEVVLLKRFSSSCLKLPTSVKSALLQYVRHYHAREREQMDCYAFANCVGRVQPHKVAYMLRYWKKQKMPFFLRRGSVVFFESGANHFHHAAVYIGRGLYLSVYGAGGDIEITTMAEMRALYRDTTRVVLAGPLQM